jgi:hypothetical protein
MRFLPNASRQAGWKLSLPYLYGPELTRCAFEVLDLLASGLSDRVIVKRLVVNDESPHRHPRQGWGWVSCCQWGASLWGAMQQIGAPSGQAPGPCP